MSKSNVLGRPVNFPQFPIPFLVFSYSFLKTWRRTNSRHFLILHHSPLKVEDKLEGENTTLRFVDSWTVFRADAGLAHLALHLRQKWSALFLRRLQSPGKPMTQIDLAVLDAVVSVLTAEEAELGLTQPYGIGQRPKMILGSDNICSSPGKLTSIRVSFASDRSY